jgi:hypothetical protein
VLGVDAEPVKTATGWVRGYNAQAAVNDRQIIVACHVSQDANDVGLHQPMVDTVAHTLEQVGITHSIGLVLADAGYWSEDNATRPTPSSPSSHPRPTTTTDGSAAADSLQPEANGR